MIKKQNHQEKSKMPKIVKTEFVNIHPDGSISSEGKRTPVSELPPSIQNEVKQSDDFETKLGQMYEMRESGKDTKEIEERLKTHPHNQGY